MKIETCTIADVERILSLYESARRLQTEKGMGVWPLFEKAFIEKEVNEHRQWKLVIDNIIACNWANTFEDREIWEEKEKGDAIYIHRIATNPIFRGTGILTKL